MDQEPEQMEQDAAYCAALGLPGSVCVVREETDPQGRYRLTIKVSE